jgi:hypothetical protein
MMLTKLKRGIIELNLFVEKNKLTINQQIMATRIFFVLFSSMPFQLFIS